MKSLRNPVKLKPMQKGHLVQVIIETPAEAATNSAST